MFSGSLSELLFQVITSWQVIAVTIALVAFMFIVNHVARTYHSPRFASKSRPQKVKPAKAAKSGPKVVSDSEDSNEALDLEEG
jgi:hypothetical protein